VPRKVAEGNLTTSFSDTSMTKPQKNKKKRKNAGPQEKNVSVERRDGHRIKGRKGNFTGKSLNAFRENCT